MVEVRSVSSTEEVELIRGLFREYEQSLGFPLCFQGFERELAELPGKYAPPSGRLLLAYANGELAGCAALRMHDNGICELKRMYVRPAFRGLGLGRLLAGTIISEARCIGYERMRLDTLTSMTAARALYYSLGFKEIGPYRENPIEGALFMELTLGEGGRTTGETGHRS